MNSSIRYIVPESPRDGALRLHCNEGAVPPVTGGETVREYPNVSGLQRAIAARVGRQPEEVVITEGADGAIDRVMRAFAGPRTRVAVAEPTFEMIAVYAAQTGADVIRLPWDDDYPCDDVIAARPDVVALVTPDNPTGRAIDWTIVVRIATELPDALVLLDLAYVEYADEDFTAAAAALPNVVVTRTFSKAWGLAGLRVGYALAGADLAERLRSVGSPYPVSSASIELVERCLRTPDYVDAHVRVVRNERAELASLLADLGCAPVASQANFVLARFTDASLVADVLRFSGIEVRKFSRAGLENALRIGCPGTSRGYERLESALRQALQPDALLFDMDGVLADVRGSYRAAIIDTCAGYGVSVDGADIAREKTKAQSNDDFVVTRRLLLAAGVDAPLELITKQFQTCYDDGLWRRESLLVDREFLTRLAARRPLAIVTGRPRPDAERFLESFEIRDLFDVVVCREDAAMKPDPAPVQLALEQLGASSAWMFGDTVDDLTAATSAGVLPVGVTAPGEDSGVVLSEVGAVRVVQNVQEVERWLN